MADQATQPSASSSAYDFQAREQWVEKLDGVRYRALVWDLPCGCRVEIDPLLPKFGPVAAEAVLQLVDSHRHRSKRAA